MLVGVLALQGDVAEHSAALADLGVAGRAVRRPPDLLGLDGIVLPGGESTTLSMLLASSGLAEPLGKEIDAGLPVFGTCAGLILLARTVTGGRPDQTSFKAIDLTVRRNGYGRQCQSFECELDVPVLGPDPVPAVFIRAPVVESTGPGVEILATVGVATASAPPGAGGVELDGKTTPVICRQRSVLVSAFHPELTGDRRVHGLFVTMIQGTRPTEEGRGR